MSEKRQYLRPKPQEKPPLLTTWRVTHLPDRSNPVKLFLTLDTTAVGVLGMFEQALRHAGIELTREGEDEELKRRTG